MAFDAAPLFVVPLIIYSILSYFLTGWQVAYLFVSHFTGVPWGVTGGDAFTMLCLMVLFVEIVKATRPGNSTILNHGLSMLVCVSSVILFVKQPTYTTTPFLMLVLMSIFDVVAGYTVSIVSARRDFGFH